MAWKFPHQSIQGEFVLDIEPINQNFLSVVSETSGYLNEHNFKATSTPILSRVGDIAPKLPDNIAHRLFYSRPTAARSPLNLAGENWTKIAPKDFYQTKTIPGMGLTATFRGGKVWLCGSFNIHTHGKGRPAFVTDPDTTISNDKGFGFNCALQVDGAIVNESLVGTGDPTLENYIQGVPNVDNSPSPPEITFFKRGGGGINGGVIPVVVDTVLDLTPGQHTIRIAIMDIRSSNGSGTGRTTYVSTTELFCLELTR